MRSGSLIITNSNFLRFYHNLELSSHDIFEGQTCNSFSVTWDDLFDFCFVNFPDTDSHISAHSQAVNTINSEVAVPNPSSVAWKILVLLEFFGLLIVSPDLASFIRTTRSQKLLVWRKLAFQDVLSIMSTTLLNSMEVVCHAINYHFHLATLSTTRHDLGTLTLPKVEDSFWGTHDELACISWYLKRSDSNLRNVQLLK